MTISFSCTSRDLALIDACARRALAIDTEANDEPRSMRDWQMDFCAVHANGCPMDLKRLLNADDFNFAHDAFGIARHLDRDDSSPTGGQLLNCFLPRFAAKERLKTDAASA